MVRFYQKGVLVKAHPRQPRGGRSTDPADFPEAQRVYALRDVTYLREQARDHGAMIGAFAARVLDDPLPWTRMRRVYALLGLVRKYGAAPVEQACAIALGAEMLSAHRLKRMLLLGSPVAAAPAPPHPPSPPARYLRPVEQSALPLAAGTTKVAHEC